MRIFSQGEKRVLLQKDDGFTSTNPCWIFKSSMWMKLLSGVSLKAVNDIPALIWLWLGFHRNTMHFYSTQELKPQKKHVELHLFTIYSPFHGAKWTGITFSLVESPSQSEKPSRLSFFTFSNRLVTEHVL